MSDSPPPLPIPAYSTLRVKRSRILPTRVAYSMILLASALLVAAGQVLSLALGFFYDGRRNANPAFIFTQLDLASLVIWFAAFASMVLILVFTRRRPRIVAAIALTMCALAITPLQCEQRRMPLDRYEAGFLQWTSMNVRPGPIVAWQATLPPVTAPKNLPAIAWSPVVAALRPSSVIQMPTGIILEWGMIGAWGNSRRVFIGANGTVAPPTSDENVSFNWKPLGPGFFAAYQTTD